MEREAGVRSSTPAVGPSLRAKCLSEVSLAGQRLGREEVGWAERTERLAGCSAWRTSESKCLRQHRSIEQPEKPITEIGPPTLPRGLNCLLIASKRVAEPEAPLLQLRHAASKPFRMRKRRHGASLPGRDVPRLRCPQSSVGTGRLQKGNSLSGYCPSAVSD